MEIKNNQELHLGLGTAVVGGAVGAVADAVKQHNYLKDIDGCLAKAHI